MDFKACVSCQIWWPKPALTRDEVCPICYGVSDKKDEEE